MITNHGIHQWQVIPGLPDTGGQNVFVNQLTGALTEFGFKITIVNRGGYPHPATGEERQGLRYRDEHQRILYLEDDKDQFIRKEDMAAQLPALAQFLTDFLAAEAAQIDLIISHYWDGARLGVLYNDQLAEPIKHVWVPHSLGMVKKRNVSPDQWADLRIEERIEIEQQLARQVDAAAATSPTIRQSLQADYGYQAEPLFMPPCIDTGRYAPRRVAAGDEIWQFLSQCSGLSPEAIRQRKIITEISRTDTTKRKDILIKAVAQTEGSFLIVSIDENNPELAEELKELIQAGGIAERTAVVGSVWDRLPTLYAITDIYCTPSIMEGFGMSAQEAAATKTAIVASHLVPFAVEYLLGERVDQIEGDHTPLKRGEGAIVVQADEVAGFAHALNILLANDDLRRKMAQNAYDITIPQFTWDQVVRRFLAEIDEER